MMLGVAPNDDCARGAARAWFTLDFGLAAASASGAGVLSTPMRRNTASAARSPDSQAPPTVPHNVSCAASPANQTAFCTGSISTRRAPCQPGVAAENAPPTSGLWFQRVACERLIVFFTSAP